MDSVLERVTTDAPDANDAARRLERIRESATLEGSSLPADDDAVAVLALVCQRAPYLATLLARDPTRLGRVSQDPYLRREKPRDVLALELAAHTERATSDDDLARVLRTFRADEMVRLGVREMEFGTQQEVGRELAWLADVSFDAAIDYHRAQLVDELGEPHYVDADGRTLMSHLAVIAMGKHGGEELNFTSDVDVIYVYNSDNGTSDEWTLNEFFSKLAERVTAALGEVTEDDTVFRVDLRLRPEGSRGPIANSLPSMERYYETWGRPWERQAWLKARPCAGDLELGEETLHMLAPFVYPRALSPSVVDEVRSLNRRIKAELDVSGIETGFDVKNGVGGIREVEFFVQALQLVHAGPLPALRARPTLIALDQLLFAGIITETERSQLAEAYLFLRRVEHMLQLDSGRQTQRLPSDTTELDRLAKRLSFVDAETFQTTLELHTGAVTTLFATLGDEEDGPPDQVLALLETDDDNLQRQLVLLAQLGYRDPRQAAHQLSLARNFASSPLAPTARGAAARVAPNLLAEISASPDPDLALAHLVELIRRRSSWAAVWRLMDENPTTLRLLASLLGTSAYLSRHFIERPELVDALLSVGRAPPKLEKVQVAGIVDARLAATTYEEERWDVLAESKNERVLHIALADIGGAMTPRDVGDELSKLAEVCLERALDIVRGALMERHGTPTGSDGSEASLAILALGKLGGEELGYASDLDLIFVYSQDGETTGPKVIDNVVYMTRIGQRLMGGLHTLHRAGRLYEVDTRLRPSGSQGLLVSSCVAWERYHRSKAELWERQALTKIRAVAGDLELGQRVVEIAHDCVYGSPVDATQRAGIAARVHSMRERIEQELGGSARGFDVKVGRGGLIDIEFAAQYLQLVYGHAHTALRSPSTVDVLARAPELGLADTDACAILAQAYDFIRGLEHRMRMVHDEPVRRLPRDPEEMTKLAQRANFPDSESLRQAYENWTKEVRHAYSVILGLGT